MKKIVFCTLLSFGAVFNASAQKPVPPAAIQIKTALLAAPETKREGATVIGRNEKGEFVVLRKGTNEMICLADDPQKDGLNVACYHKNMEPFMKRGRDLRKAGKSSKEIAEIRENEVKAGKLLMPEKPSTLYVYSAEPEDYDVSTGEVKKGYLRYVIYTPFATAESTGLPLKPDTAGMPWIMDPGTAHAHIMINP
ncbi:hypothetical protein [Rubrolithibacter danxiaensis]|uniref:hypothetical protein n=1 Tax=Rubrolithibacter danxiaensis TaxID=3390805 RepID=UPI003BF89606